jgi:hypothetical protein
MACPFCSLKTIGTVSLPILALWVPVITMLMSLSLEVAVSKVLLRTDVPVLQVCHHCHYISPSDL